jgi:hypothetical protein
MENKRMIEVASGNRRNMAMLERELIRKNPGPLNFERWLRKD